MDYHLLIARILFVLTMIAFLGLILLFISTLCSIFIIDTTEYTISSKKIPTTFNNYKILQISDLHNYSFGENNSKLLKKINEISPDIIVLTGDMVNTKTNNFNNFYSFAKEISKQYDTFYIMGNHELRLNGTQQLDIIKKLKSFGIKVLNNAETTILKDNESIAIYGLHQPITSYKNALKNTPETDFTIEHMKQTFPIIDNTKFNILLSHSPFEFDVFSKWGADLVLAGHVHGGIIRLPFIGGILSPERTFFPKYDAGEYTLNNSKMIVSRGLGNGTINLRFFNNPELCIITLKNSKKNS